MPRKRRPKAACQQEASKINKFAYRNFRRSRAPEVL